MCKIVKVHYNMYQHSQQQPLPGQSAVCIFNNDRLHHSMNAQTSVYSWYNGYYYHHYPLSQEQQLWAPQIWHDYSSSASNGSHTNNFVEDVLFSPNDSMSSSEFSIPEITANNVKPQTFKHTAQESTELPFEWLKKSSRSDDSKSKNLGKTRTRDKYRVVYNERQKFELEKEFRFNQFINSKRKSELSASLDLSERQIKIWFQNRRAKERKSFKKKIEETGKTFLKPPQSHMEREMIDGFPTNHYLCSVDQENTETNPTNVI